MVFFQFTACLPMAKTGPSHERGLRNLVKADSEVPRVKDS